MDRQSTFGALARIRSTTHRVITYDRRGYARSRSLPGPYTVDAHLEDLAAVVNGRPAVVYGHSFGGALALAFAYRHPDLTLGVAVYESPMSWESFWSFPGGITAELGESRSRPGSSPEDIAERFMVRMVGERRWLALPEATREQRRAEGHTLVGDIGDLMRGRPYELGGIACPVVSAVGAGSQERFQRSATIIAESCVDARLVSVDGWHHNAHVAHPEQFDHCVVEPLVRRVTEGKWPELPAT